MFRKRLTWFWILLTGAALLLLARLTDIQVVHADQYEDLAARLLTRPVRYLRAPRGGILDRHRRVLVSHEPSYDVCVHYAALGDDNTAYLLSLARQLRRRGDFPAYMSTADVADELRFQIGDMWLRLAALTGEPVSAFQERGAQIRAKVARVRDAVRDRHGIDQPVAEERWLHPIIEDVPDDLAVAIRLELEHLPWLAVVPSSRRVAHQADAVAHLLGQLGAVSPERLAADPLRADDLRRLHPTDRCGTTGIERVAETMLRGTRGRISVDLDGTELEHIDPITGQDVELTIDMEIQETVLAMLADAIDGRDVHGNQRLTWPAGGAAVVLDVATREILALVSYPVYNYAELRTNYDHLIRDARRQPTRFRAVAGLYPPGSTCKAITLVGALTDGVTTPHERIHCTGHLLPDNPNIFRCWIFNQWHYTHDAVENPAGQNAVDAIRNSCNLYFFKTGGRLGPDRLCDWFSLFGLGRTQGTALIEESAGIVPTEERLGRPFVPADPWNFSIGQGEVTATPLQVANVAASIAAGHWAPVKLIRNASGPPESSQAQAGPPFDTNALRVLRTGMWLVVNDRPHGEGGWWPTGRHARLNRDDYVLCGKTGSAQAQPHSVLYRYTFEFPDGHRETRDAFLQEDALAQFDEPRPQCVGWHTIERYPSLPAGEPLPAHAWFMGYTQPAATPRGEQPDGPAYAIAVIVEYGGSGGRVAGPLVKQIAEWLLENRP